MPFTFFAHQAPVLPLKLARPAWFSGTALAIGSMAPDLEYFLYGAPERVYGHTLGGQFLFCLPLTLLLVWIVRRVIARPLGSHLPDCGPFHLRDYRLLAGIPGGSYWLKAAAGALIGSFSHLALDSFTHGDGWSVQRLALLRLPLFEIGGRTVYVWKALQHGGTLVAGALTLLMLYFIGRRRLLVEWEPASGPPERTSAATARRLWLPIPLCALLAGILGVLTAGAPYHWLELDTWIAILFPAATGSFVGLCIGSVLSGREMRVEER